jgi:hypothetical protein
MSTLTSPAPEASAIWLEPAEPKPRWQVIDRLATGLSLVVKAAIGALLCFHYATSWLVVGWTFRLMRRRILRGWWRASPERERVPFEGFALDQQAGASGQAAPNWLVSEQWRTVLSHPDRHGRAPSVARRVARLPRALLGGLGWNARMSIMALACTYTLTLPGCFLWLAAWYDGWNNSFNKGYEQALVGPLTGLLGSALFMAAMMYVPMAWAHLAATADPRAFFHFGFVARLVRLRPGAAAIYALLFSLATLVITVLRVAPAAFSTALPALEGPDPAAFQRILLAYNLVSGGVAFLLFVFVHLLAARMYRKAVLKLLDRDPGQAGTLHPRLFHALSTLSLLPAGPAPSRHPVAAVILGTGRGGWNLMLRAVVLALWFSVVAQLFISEFLHYHPIVGWMNLPLVHLPSLYLFPAGTA